MAMLEGEIEDLIAQLHGGRIDEEVFATMQPDDVETVRELLGPSPDFEVDEEWAPTEHDTLDEDARAGAGGGLRRRSIEAEITRLESEIEIAKQRRQALERYLEALGD